MIRDARGKIVSPTVSATVGDGDVITPRVRVIKARATKTGTTRGTKVPGEYAVTCVSLAVADLAMIDRFATAAKMSRSSYMASAALACGTMDPLRVQLEAMKRRLGE